MRRLLWLSVFFLLISCNPKNSPDNVSENIVDESIQVPKGFKAYVFADNLGRGRHIAVNENGDVYLALRRPVEGGGIVALRDNNNDHQADEINYFGDYSGTGIGVHKGYLYFGSNEEVVRYKMNSGSLLPDPRAEIIVTDFPVQSQHEAKPFTFDDQGNMYVNVGAPSNACMERTRTKGSPGMDPCPQLERQAGIWKFKDDQTGQQQVGDGQRYATGIRNSVALDWNEHSGHLYVVQHGRDQLHSFFPDLYSVEDNAKLPAEELLLVEEGSDFGWPYCYYDQLQNKKVLAPEYGGDGYEVGRCDTKDDPILAFPGHIAPNDIHFYGGAQFPERYLYGAFIAFHGSWNRSPLEQEGFYVAFVPFNKEYPVGDWEIFADGFAGTRSIDSPRDAEHRPTGLAEGPDGSIYIVDSVEGKIWKIVYDPN